MTKKPKYQHGLTYKQTKVQQQTLYSGNQQKNKPKLNSEHSTWIINSAEPPARAQNESQACFWEMEFSTNRADMFP